MHYAREAIKAIRGMAHGFHPHDQLVREIGGTFPGIQ